MSELQFKPNRPQKKGRGLLHGADGVVITENKDKSVIQFVLFSAFSVQKTVTWEKREWALMRRN